MSLSSKPSPVYIRLILNFSRIFCWSSIFISLTSIFNFCVNSCLVYFRGSPVVSYCVRSKFALLARASRFSLSISIGSVTSYGLKRLAKGATSVSSSGRIPPSSSRLLSGLAPDLLSTCVVPTLVINIHTEIISFGFLQTQTFPFDNFT